MTTEMIRLEKLYAKGKLVWKDANEWDSSKFSGTYFKMVEVKDFLYVLTSTNTSGSAILYQIDSRTGTVNWTVNFPKITSDHSDLKANEEFVCVYNTNNGAISGAPDAAELTVLKSDSTQIGDKLILQRSSVSDYWVQRPSVLVGNSLYLSESGYFCKYNITDTSVSLVYKNNLAYQRLFYFDGYIYGTKKPYIVRINPETGETETGPRVDDGFFSVINNSLYYTNGSKTFEIDTNMQGGLSIIRELVYPDFYPNKFESATSGNRMLFSSSYYNMRVIASVSETGTSDFVTTRAFANTLAEGKNDHIYFVDENNRIKKRKLYKHRIFNVELEQEEA